MRSSCEASAMNARRRSSLAWRREKASSSRSSMPLSAIPSRPTSVRGSVASTRWERSPPAIRPAVWPMRSSGSSPIRTTTQPATPSSSSTAPITSASTSSSRSSCWSASRIGTAAISDPAAQRIALGEHAVAAVVAVDGEQPPERHLLGQVRLGGDALADRQRDGRRPGRGAQLAVGAGGRAERVVAARARRPPGRGPPSRPSPSSSRASRNGASRVWSSTRW